MLIIGVCVHFMSQIKLVQRTDFPEDLKSSTEMSTNCHFRPSPLFETLKHPEMGLSY